MIISIESLSLLDFIAMVDDVTNVLTRIAIQRGDVLMLCGVETVAKHEQHRLHVYVDPVAIK